MIKTILYSISLLFIGGLIEHSIVSYQQETVASNLNKQQETICDQKTANVQGSIAKFFSQPMEGRLKVELDPKYNFTISMDAVPIYTLPEPPDTDLPTGHIDGLKPFDEYEGYNGIALYSQQYATHPRDPGWQVQEFNIDHDRAPEQIMINSLTMTSQPHLVRIVKNGMVVFEYAGSVVGVEEIYGNNPPMGREIHKPGFILTSETWQDRNGFRVRYVVKDDGSIEPLWQQRHAGIENTVFDD
jgi:hypothetical protein